MLPSAVFRGLILILICANAVITAIQTDEKLVSNNMDGILFQLLVYS